MSDRYWIIFFLVLFSAFQVFDASLGDADPLYKSCVEECEKTGCVNEICFENCKSSSDYISTNTPWYTKESLALKWKKIDCKSDCRYNCMINREKDRASLTNNHEPIKYHGKWPFSRKFGLQEPVSVAFSVLNLLMHLHGWLSFIMFVYYKLPLNPDKRPFYNYTFLWHIYALLSMNAWFWSAIFHTRDADITEALDYSSAIALIGYSLLLSILRSFKVRDEAARVMVAAPLLAFVTTHILYLNNFKMDYGWNMKVCVIMGISQLVIWSIWGGITQHPSRYKLWIVVIGGGFAMLLEIYDFPPYEGLVDAHALWHASTVPLTFLWWSFIKDDAQFHTSQLLKKVK